MPGKDGTFRVEAQVSGFTMSGITFAAVPFSMGIETPDTTELVSGFRQLGDGVGELKAGAERPGERGKRPRGGRGPGSGAAWTASRQAPASWSAARTSSQEARRAWLRERRGLRKGLRD